MESRAKLDLILADFRQVLTDPAGFYRNMVKSGGFADPVIFLLVMAVIAGLMMAIVSLFGIGLVGAMAAGFAAIITLPIAAVIGSFIAAAIMFVIWKLMGSNHNFETAYRCVAYASAVYPVLVILGMIPYLGTIVSVAWGIYLMITASVEVHQLQRKAAMTVLGILGGIMLLFNLSSEYAARSLAEKAEQFSQQMEGIGEQFKDFEDMTPEEAGKAMGEFFKGINDVAKEMEAEQQGDPNASKRADSEQTPDSQDMTPEEAGRALGEFFKGLHEATKEIPQNTPTANEASTSAAASTSAEQGNN